MANKDFPKIIQEVGFDFKWDEKKVWILDYPVEKMPLVKLEWHFKIPFHWNDRGIYNLSSIEIIGNPKKFKEEFDRAMNSDLNYPIDIMWNKGRWLILDGLHRLMKAKIIGMENVIIRKIPRSEIPSIRK